MYVLGTRMTCLLHGRAVRNVVYKHILVRVRVVPFAGIRTCRKVHAIVTARDYQQRLVIWAGDRGDCLARHVSRVVRQSVI